MRSLQNHKMGILIQEFDIAFMIIIFSIACILITDGKWLSPGNLYNLIGRASILGLLALGQAIVLISGQIDLSIASLLALFCGIYSYILIGGYGILLALLVATIVILIIGIINGLLASKTTIPAFVITLGTMMIARSLHYYILGAARYVPQVQDIIYGVMAQIPKGRELFPTFIWGIMFLIFFYILNSTKVGKHIYAVGGDIRTASVTGISVSKIKLSAFIFSTILVITASFIFIYRVAYIAPNAGELYLLDSIAAPIIGGIYLFGGRGKLWKVIAGAFFLEILLNFMHLIGVSPLIFPAVKGALIAIGVMISLAFTPSYLKTRT